MEGSEAGEDSSAPNQDDPSTAADLHWPLVSMANELS